MFSEYLPYRMHPRLRSLSIMRRSLFRLLLCVLLCVIMQLSNSHAATTSSNLVSLTKTILLEAGKVGLDEAGTRILGSAWPYFKAGLKPVFQELQRRIPALSSLLSAPGPESESASRGAVNEISKDSSLQNAIIDGFANLKEGQREILKQLGNIEKVLAGQDAKLSDFQTKSDKKLDEIILLLKESRKQPTTLDYTGGVTMYDIEGTYTLLREVPSGCSFEQGSLGITIRPINAFEAYGDYDLQTDYTVLPGQKEKGCMKFEGYKNWKLQLYGTILRVPISEEWYMAREVSQSGCMLMLSWDDGKGVKHQWHFLKDGCK